MTSLFSGLNQLISRALFDGVWIGKDDLEVLRAALAGSIGVRDTTGLTYFLLVCDELFWLEVVLIRFVTR